MIFYFKPKNIILSFIFLTFFLAFPQLSLSMDNAAQHIPSPIIALESGKTPEYAILVEKQTQKLSLFSYNGTFQKLYSFNCSTGEVPGEKKKSGDKKTPEGVYFFTGSFEKKYLSAVYGDWAFPMDYPNHLDKIHGHEGNSIWMHGSDKPIKPRNSNGCIVLANNDINILSKYITLHKTPIIVTKALSYVPPGKNIKTRQAVNQFINEWHIKMMDGSFDEYHSFYAPEYTGQLEWWTEWVELNNFFKKSVSSFTIDIKPVSIFQFNGVYVACFDQVIRINNQDDFSAGSRKLYISHDKDELRIIGDEYQNTSKKAEESNPLLASCKNIKLFLDAEKEISELINQWIVAWSSKDIETYGNCYASDFRFKKQDRNAWLRKKRRLNKKYKYINVRKEDLVIKKGKQTSVVTFTQYYESSGYSAVGKKKLLLKQEDGQWKIYREIWKKI